MIDIKWNEMNEVWVKVDWDTHKVEILDLDFNSLPFVRGWGGNDTRDYPAVRIPKTKRLMLVHRLVGYTYLEDEFNLKVESLNGDYKKLVIDHIDNNPDNPMPDNLRWCTQTENIKYRKHQPKYKKSPV